jgi:hypothetical protein
MARTAVVAGTATAVSNRVSRRQAERWQRQEQPQPARYDAPQPAYAEPPPAPAAPAAPSAGTRSELTVEIQRLADLRDQGILTDEEFAAAKARILGL